MRPDVNQLIVDPDLQRKESGFTWSGFSSGGSVFIYFNLCSVTAVTCRVKAGGLTAGSVTM